MPHIHEPTRLTATRRHLSGPTPPSRHMVACTYPNLSLVSLALLTLPFRRRMYYLASFVCERSLLELDTLCYLPSMVAASAVYLARKNCNLRTWVRDLSTLMHCGLSLPLARRERGNSTLGGMMRGWGYLIGLGNGVQGGQGSRRCGWVGWIR